MELVNRISYTNYFLRFYLKMQLRQGLYFIPIILYLTEILAESYLIVFIFLQFRFLNVYNQEDFYLPTIRQTGAHHKELILSYNLSWIIWFNLWFFLVYFTSWVIKGSLEIFPAFFDFNILLIACFITGNSISGILVSKCTKKIVHYILASLFFSAVIIATYISVYIIGTFKYAIFMKVFITAISFCVLLLSTKHKNI